MCKAFGAVMSTRSISGSATSARQSPVAVGEAERAPRRRARGRRCGRRRCAARSRRAGRRRAAAVAKPKTWVLPMKPVPIRPIREGGLVSLPLARASVDHAAPDRCGRRRNRARSGPRTPPCARRIRRSGRRCAARAPPDPWRAAGCPAPAARPRRRRGRRRPGVPRARAAISAASSTTPPRAVLTRTAVGFITASSAARDHRLVGLRGMHRDEVGPGEALGEVATGATAPSGQPLAREERDRRRGSPCRSPRPCARGAGRSGRSRR